LRARADARRQLGAIRSTGGESEPLVSRRGSYLAESNFFETACPQAFCGSDYLGLLAMKDKYVPGGLFVVHHGVGSERWSGDGFSRLGTWGRVRRGDPQTQVGGWSRCVARGP